MKKVYEFRHLLVQSRFDHTVNEVVFDDEQLRLYGNGGFYIKAILPTAKDGWYDIFLEKVDYIDSGQ